ncbi:MAG: 4-aminobutyrate aminotransferase-like enzyme [Planctomycetota bacterium]|jgi:4-aminobutyrate aminotransferase-like enzyme
MSMTNAFQPGSAALSDHEKSMIERRERLLGPAYKLFYQQPIHIVRGEGVWLYDKDNNPYLDVYNNVPSVGHCHPKVIEATMKQTGLLNSHSRYLHDNVLDYAEHLLSKFPPELGLSNAMFTCTGSEANDLAYRICKYNTGGDGFIVTDLAYHGGTDVIASMSPSLGEYVTLGANVRLVPAPNAFRGSAHVGMAFANNVRAAAEDLKRHGVQPAALLVDTIFSSDGVFAEPAGFLQEAVDVIHEFGGLFIADEVQPGFGRTGEEFWGFQRHRVSPDLVTMGKGMGGGHPLAGVVARPQLLEALGRSRYFNTTGGTAVSCAIGKSILEVIESEALMENAKDVGNYLIQSLREMMSRHEVIGDVRGAGLFIGVEIVTGRETNNASASIASKVVNELRQKRVLLSSSGPGANVLKIRPPLPFNRDNADRFLQSLDEVLSTV